MACKFFGVLTIWVGWRRLSTESAGVGGKRLWLTGLTDDVERVEWLSNARRHVRLKSPLRDVIMPPRRRRCVTGNAEPWPLLNRKHSGSPLAGEIGRTSGRWPPETGSHVVDRRALWRIESWFCWLGSVTEKNHYKWDEVFRHSSSSADAKFCRDNRALVAMNRMPLCPRMLCCSVYKVVYNPGLWLVYH